MLSFRREVGYREAAVARPETIVKSFHYHEVDFPFTLERIIAFGGSDSSALMLAAAVTARVTPSAVRMPATETLPAAVEALRRTPSASHMEAA